MKTWIMLLAPLLVCVSILGCGTDRTIWSCVCTGGNTIAVCAEDFGDAQNQALARWCAGAAGCGCECVDTLLEDDC